MPNKKVNTTKILAALSTLGIVGVSLANAQTISQAVQGATQTPTTTGQNMPKGRHHNGMFGERKKIEDAIISGDFATFQTVASSSPLKGIDQVTFNLLTPQFIAKKNAESQIQAILKNAGIVKPVRDDDKN